MSATCRFCLLPDADRVLARTSNFAVMLSLGPIVEGYVVIVAREHHSCVAALPEELLDELLAVRDAVASAQRRVYGSSLYFEHGRSGSCVPAGSGEDHCYHAHLHLAPTELDLFGAVSKDYELTRFATWPEWWAAYAESGLPYIAVEAPAGEGIGVAFDPPLLPKQYLRNVLARLAGHPELADWTKQPGADVIALGKARLEAAVLESLGERGLAPIREWA